MSSATLQTQYNTGCCFPIKRSAAIKETTLLITAAIATIAVVGGILAVLAMNGVNLGPLNSITNSFTTLIPEKYIYIGLTAATGLLLIDTVLIAALTRSYNKSVEAKNTEKMDSINRSDISDIEDEDDEIEDEDDEIEDDDEIEYHTNPITAQKYNAAEEGEGVQLDDFTSKKAGSDEVNIDQEHN